MRFMFVVSLLALSTPAWAQTPTGQILTIYPDTGLTPAAVTTLVGPSCNLPGPLPADSEVQNPREVWWDDPVNAGRFCRWVDGGGGPLLALPFGAQRYRATLRFTNQDGAAGPESPRSNPFFRPTPLPAAPARVLVGSGSQG
jgi:hypothetical protein